MQDNIPLPLSFSIYEIISISSNTLVHCISPNNNEGEKLTTLDSMYVYIVFLRLSNNPLWTGTLAHSFVFTAGNMHLLFIQGLQKCDLQIGNAFWHISINIIKTVEESLHHHHRQKGSLTWHIKLFAFRHSGVCLDTTTGFDRGGTGRCHSSVGLCSVRQLWLE